MTHEPQLDHYVGRGIEEVVIGMTQVSEPAYSIVLTGNKRLNFYGTPPSELEVGMELLAVTSTGDQRDLRFGHTSQDVINHYTLVTQQGQYAISDADHPEGMGWGEPEELPVIPDPSPDRDKGQSTSGN